MTTRPLLALVRKDLLLFLRDRRAVVLAFAVPLAMTSFVALLLGEAPAGAGPRPWVWVADLDRGGLARRVVEAMDREGSFVLMRGAEADEVRAEVRQGRAAAAVVIPRGFGDDVSRARLASGPPPELVVIHDPDRPVEAAMVRGLLARHVVEALDDGPRRPPPFSTRDEAAGREGPAAPEAMARAFGGMAVQFALFAAIESGIGLLDERRRGLWKRLRAAPLSRWALLLARGLSGTIVALMILAAVLGLGFAAFGLRARGGAVGLGLVALAYAACAAGLGLVIAALGRTPQAARGISAMVILLMAALGGAWVPTTAFPGPLRRWTPLLPTRWAVDGFEAALAGGESLAGIMRCALALVGFAAAFAALAAWRFRWEE